MATMYAGYGNVFVPSFDKQANLIINYARDPKKYAINSLMTHTPVSEPIGRFPRIKPEAQGQITANTGQSSRWADGAPRPIMLETGQKHEWLSYFCDRYIQDFPIGYETEKNAAWDIVTTQTNALANRMMSLRAYDFYTVLQTTGNYATGNFSDTATLAGGVWSSATSTNRYIQKSLRAGVAQIVKATMNGVTADDCVLVVGPTVAGKMAESAEIADYLAQNPDATRYIEGDLFKNQLANYGLPPRLYGISVVVDPLVLEQSSFGATANKVFATGDTSAYLITKGGSLNGMAGGGSFSFIHCFEYTPEEFLVETIDDYINKRKILSVVDTRQVASVASESGYLFTNCVV